MESKTSGNDRLVGVKLADDETRSSWIQNHVTEM